MLLLVAGMAGQTPAPLTLLSQDGRATLPLEIAGGRELVALDDLAAAFQLTVREEAGAITVSYSGRTVVLTPEQALASVAGRLVSLTAPPVRANGRWLVPLDFISRALAPISDVPLDLRPASSLVVVGNLRVPRVTIRQESFVETTRVTIESSPASANTITQETGRLLIQFEADALDTAAPQFQPLGLLQAVAIVEPSTLALELGPRFISYRSSTQSTGSATRLVIDLMAATVETAAPAPAPTSPELPVFGRPASAVRTLVIDPGHGGEDEGAAGPDGTLEKDLTLAVARRLRATIERQLGIRVLLTRDDDRDVPLDRRTAVANNNKADVFISLHANASMLPSARGAAVYTAAFDDIGQEQTAPRSERVALFGGGSRDLALVPWELAQTNHLDRSAELARLVVGRLENEVPLDTPPLNRAPFRVLESANMPAILVEMGYLTNPSQEGLLKENAFQSALVRALYGAIVQFRGRLAASGGAR